MEIDAAVERAITECIEEGILADFLRKHRAEAKKMSLYEYDAKRQRRFDREEGREEGLKEGLKVKQLENIRNLMESTGWSVQKSMDMLKIPIDEQKKLLPEI